MTTFFYFSSLVKNLILNKIRVSCSLASYKAAFLYTAVCITKMALIRNCSILNREMGLTYHSWYGSVACNKWLCHSYFSLYFFLSHTRINSLSNLQPKSSGGSKVAIHHPPSHFLITFQLILHSAGCLPSIHQNKEKIWHFVFEAIFAYPLLTIVRYDELSFEYFSYH